MRRGWLFKQYKSCIYVLIRPGLYVICAAVRFHTYMYLTAAGMLGKCCMQCTAAAHKLAYRMRVPVYHNHTGPSVLFLWEAVGWSILTVRLPQEDDRAPYTSPPSTFRD